MKQSHRFEMKKKLCPTEFEEQAAVIKWARKMAALLYDSRLELLHGDSSGVCTSIGQAVKMKRAGAIRGWPDLFLPVPCESHPGQYYCCGLFIELKRVSGGVVSVDQRAVHDLLRKNGYRVEVCRGADEAIKVIMDYLGL
jgi:hypothetical protein